MASINYSNKKIETKDIYSNAINTRRENINTQSTLPFKKLNSTKSRDCSFFLKTIRAFEKQVYLAIQFYCSKWPSLVPFPSLGGSSH